MTCSSCFSLCLVASNSALARWIASCSEICCPCLRMLTPGSSVGRIPKPNPNRQGRREVSVKMSHLRAKLTVYEARTVRTKTTEWTHAERTDPQTAKTSTSGRHNFNPGNRRRRDRGRRGLRGKSRVRKDNTRHNARRDDSRCDALVQLHHGQTSSSGLCLLIEIDWICAHGSFCGIVCEGVRRPRQGHNQYGPDNDATKDSRKTTHGDAQAK